MRAAAFAVLGAAFAVSVAATGATVAAGLGEVGGAPPGAASCSGCHAIRPEGDTAVPPIHGRPAAEIVAALDAFRAGTRAATVMNRIAPGFTPAESRAIAAWLSGQAAPR